MIYAVIVSVVALIIGVVLTIKVGMNPNDKKYHSEKGSNMSRLIWIYSVVLTLCVVIGIAFIFV